MSHSPLIPAGQGRPLLMRLLIVWCMALPIAVITSIGQDHGQLDQYLVYSYAISSLTWAFTDLPRLVLRRWLGTEAPRYWPAPVPAALVLLIAIPLGYVLGTWIGDIYAGHSTWTLLERNRQRFVGLLVSSVAISVAFVAYFYQRSKAEVLARQAQEAQLMLLQAQLEPHMLFNTLANLRALIGVDPARAQTMLDHLIGYLRATLKASRSEAMQHTLEQEFALLADYLALMEVRMGQRLRYTLELPPALLPCPVPALLLQPLVENAVRHGLEPKIDGGEVRVRARWDAQAGRLILEVQDTGVGCAQGPSLQGFGLTQVRQRLHTLFGARASLELQAVASGGTRATVTLPSTA